MLQRLHTLGLGIVGVLYNFTTVNSFARRSFRPTATSFCRHMSCTSQKSTINEEDTCVRTIHVLALHGSGGTAQSFELIVGELKDYAFFAHGLDLHITAIDAPVPKGEGYAWWSMPPSVRSFNASEYIGFDLSANKVLETMDAANPPFDLVIGHSQGAILVSALLALQKINPHPKLGYILNGGAWPNPYTKEMDSLSSSKDCRVLVVVGERDTINAPVHQERLRKALEKAGCDLTEIRHPSGHIVPTKNSDAVEQMIEWIAAGIIATI